MSKQEVERAVELGFLDGYPDFLTPEHMGEITGWTVDYVRRLCRAGVIPASRPVNHRRWFCPKPLFIAWLEGGGE